MAKPKKLPYYPGDEVGGFGVDVYTSYDVAIARLIELHEQGNTITSFQTNYQYQHPSWAIAYSFGPKT